MRVRLFLFLLFGLCSCAANVGEAPAETRTTKQHGQLGRWVGSCSKGTLRLHGSSLFGYGFVNKQGQREFLNLGVLDRCVRCSQGLKAVNLDYRVQYVSYATEYVDYDNIRFVKRYNAIDYERGGQLPRGISRPPHPDYVHRFAFIKPLATGAATCHQRHTQPQQRTDGSYSTGPATLVLWRGGQRVERYPCAHVDITAIDEELNAIRLGGQDPVDCSVALLNGK